MSAQDKWSQYIVSPNQEESQQEETSQSNKWSQYIVETKPKRPLKEEVWRKVNIPVGSAAAGFRSLPRTGFDLLKTIVEKTGGNVQDLESAQENAPEWLKKFGKGFFPTYEEARQEQFEQGAARPDTPIEKFLEKGGRFVGESPYFGGVGGVKGLLGLTGAAAGMQLGEEAQLGGFGQAALSLGGAVLAHKLGGVAESGIASLAKQKITPEVAEYIAASKEAGIDPLLTGMNPTMLQKAAQKWATHGRGGPEILKEAYSLRSGQVSKAFKNALEEAGEELFTSPYEAGQGMKDSIKLATEQIEQNKSQLYRAADKLLPENAAIVIKNPKQMEANLQKALENIGDSLLITPEQSPTYKKLLNLQNQLSELNIHDEVAMDISRLQNTNRALNEVIRYEKPGGYDKLLTPFARDIKQELERYGKINKPYGSAIKAANEYFADNVVHIRQNLLQSIANSQRPESTLAIMNSVSGIKNVEKALSSLPHGKSLLNSLKRYKLDSLLRDRIIDSSTGLMKVEQLRKMLSRGSKEYSLIKELASPEAFYSLKNLETAGKGLEKGFNALVNPSKTADTLLALNNVLSPGKKIASGVKEMISLYPERILKGTLKSLGGTVELLAPKVTAKTILSPKFANKVFKLSQAAKAKNWKSFNSILDILDNELKAEEKKKKKTNPNI